MDFDVLVTPILIIIQLPNFNQNPASKSQPKLSLKSWPKVKGLKLCQRQECSVRASYKTNFWTSCVWSYMCVCMNDHFTQHSQQDNKYQLVSVLCRRCFCRIDSSMFSILCLCTLPNVKSVAFPTTHYSITILATTFDFAFPSFKAALKIQFATFANM